MAISIRALTRGILALLISVALAPLCSAEGLTGPVRDSFVKGSYESCLKSWAANPESKSLPADLGVKFADMGAKFCTCTANLHADKTAPGDLKGLNEQTLRDPAAMIIKLQPQVKEISDYCLERVMPTK